MSKRGFVAGFVAGAMVAAGAVTWAASARNLDQEEQNLAIALEFYDVLLNQKDFEKGRQMMGDRYVQHNPNALDGFEGIENHIEMLRTTYPENRGEIVRAFTNGDLVALHVHSRRTPDSRGNAVVDMFRIENGKVVEHWDVVQAVPETALNNNTMF
jgi:predicted SnoaL-like aldol condensation-catalyzing enzyme